MPISLTFLIADCQSSTAILTYFASLVKCALRSGFNYHQLASTQAYWVGIWLDCACRSDSLFPYVVTATHIQTPQLIWFPVLQFLIVARLPHIRSLMIQNKLVVIIFFPLEVQLEKAISPSTRITTPQPICFYSVYTTSSRYSHSWNCSAWLIFDHDRAPMHITFTDTLMNALGLKASFLVLGTLKRAPTVW